MRITLFTAALLSVNLVAQTTQPTTYVRAIYGKWKEGKSAEGERFTKEVADKGSVAAMALNPDQIGRLRLKRIFPSGNEIGHDHISLFFSKTPPNLDNSQAPAGFLKGAGMTDTEYLAMQASLRTTVKMEIWTDIYRHGSISEGDFVQVRYMDPPKGKAGDYVEMTRQYESAMRAAMVQKGVMNGQQLFRLWGTEEEAPYNFVNLIAYKNSADVFKSWPSRTKSFSEVFPNGNYSTYLDHSRETSNITKYVVYRVVSATWR